MVVMFKKGNPTHQLHLSLDDAQVVHYNALEDFTFTNQQERMLRNLLKYASTQMRCVVKAEQFGTMFTMTCVFGYYCCNGNRTAKEDERGIEHFLFVTTNRNEIVQYVHDLVDQVVRNP